MKFKEFKDKVRDLPLFGGDIAKLLSADPQALRNQLLRWKKQGLIVMLKKGLYALSQSERAIRISKELVADSLYKPSYISLETALSRYKMIPEKIIPVTSVTSRKTKTFQNGEGLFIYRHLKKNAFFGFKLLHDDSGFPYFMAEPEKALLDYLYLNLGSIEADDKDYYRKSLRLQNRSILNRKKIISYAGRYGTKKLMDVLEHLK